VRCARISAAPDGASRFDAVALPMEQFEYGLATEIVPAIGFGYRAAVSTTSFPFHPAPRRQLVVVLAGAMEIGSGHGELRRFEPGDLLLVDDTSGAGHSLRHESNTRLLAVALPPELDIDAWVTEDP